MIYFVTNNKHNVVATDNLSVVHSVNGLIRFKDWLETHKEIGFDTETSGLDARKDSLLLLQAGDSETQFVFDFTCEVVARAKIFNKLQKRTLIGHNLKFDLKFIYTTLGILYSDIYDTMLAEQRLRQGFSDNEKCGGISRNRLASSDEFNPDSVIYRYLGENPKDMDKSQQGSFVGSTKPTFTQKQIEYAAADVKYLHKIKEKQEALIKRFNLEYIIYNVEFPLCSILAEIELQGFDMNAKQWVKVEENNRNKMFELECELDDLVRKYRDKLRPKDRLMLKGGKFDNIRVKNDYVPQENLFGETNYDKKIQKKDKQNKGKAYINWGSSKEIIEIFSKLNLDLPSKYGSADVAEIDYKTGKMMNRAGLTTGRTDLELYITENPLSDSVELIEKLLEYREYEARVTKYGINWLNNYLQKDGKVYTIFRQCQAKNGRFQSGGGKENDKDKYNAQNIPRSNDYRTCFHAGENNSILTIDLAGAEVTIMADKANDEYLYEIAVIKDDAHSPVITYCWKQIYLFRAGKRIGVWDNAKDFKRYKDNPRYLKYIIESDDKIVKQNYELSKEFLVTKKQNKHLRQSGKNLTFGSVYGCGAKKAAKTINVSIEEGQVYLHSISELLNKTFKFVEHKAEFALNNGYVLIDKKTKTRFWFPNAIRAIRKGEELDFMDKIEVGGQARNIPISGTQANMIKESMVNIYNWLKETGIDKEVKILSQVHDELVIKHPKIYDGVSIEWQERKYKFLYNGEYYTLPQALVKIIEDTCTSYLSNFKMKADLTIADTWIK